MRADNNLDFFGLPPGGAVQINAGISGGFIACLSAGVTSSNYPSLLLPNGTELSLYPGLIASTTTYGITSINGLQLRIRNFDSEFEGEYTCVTVDENNIPVNLTFTLYSEGMSIIIRVSKQISKLCYSIYRYKSL